MHASVRLAAREPDLLKPYQVKQAMGGAGRFACRLLLASAQARLQCGRPLGVCAAADDDAYDDSSACSACDSELQDEILADQRGGCAASGPAAAGPAPGAADAAAGKPGRGRGLARRLGAHVACIDEVKLLLARCPRASSARLPAQLCSVIRCSFLAAECAL